MAKLKNKVGPLAVMALLRDVRRGVDDPRPLAVAGARELVPLLARELRAGGDEAAVVEQVVEGAAALIWIGASDEKTLEAAARAKVPTVAVTDAELLPFADEVVRVPPGQGFPVKQITAAVARLLDEGGIALAARLPAFRGAVCAHLIDKASKRNALIGAAVFVPGVDMPILTLNQVRLVLRIALAHGEHVDRSRAIELAGVVGAGFGFRAVARELLNLVPVAGWAVKGAIAYTGTRAIGEAAVRYFEARS
jgi:uncharacterized protein (DUF697 family)